VHRTGQKSSVDYIRQDNLF